MLQEYSTVITRFRLHETADSSRQLMKTLEKSSAWDQRVQWQNKKAYRRFFKRFSSLVINDHAPIALLNT